MVSGGRGFKSRRPDQGKTASSRVDDRNLPRPPGSRTGRSPWVPEIAATIGEHHKPSRYRREPSGLVKAFRRADLVDVSHGLASFGTSRRFRRDVFSMWPDSGFHLTLLRLALGRLQTHPWSPLPIVKL